MDQLLPHNTYRKFASVYLTLVMMMHAALLYTIILLTLHILTYIQAMHNPPSSYESGCILFDQRSHPVCQPRDSNTDREMRTYLTFIAPTLRFGYPACRRFLQISSDLDFVLLHDFGSGPRVLRITASCLISFTSRIWIEKLTSASV